MESSVSSKPLRPWELHSADVVSSPRNILDVHNTCGINHNYTTRLSKSLKPCPTTTASKPFCHLGRYRESLYEDVRLPTPHTITVAAAVVRDLTGSRQA